MERARAMHKQCAAHWERLLDREWELPAREVTEQRSLDEERQDFAADAQKRALDEDEDFAADMQKLEQVVEERPVVEAADTEGKPVEVVAAMEKLIQDKARKLEEMRRMHRKKVAQYAREIKQMKATTRIYQRSQNTRCRLMHNQSVRGDSSDSGDEHPPEPRRLAPWVRQPGVSSSSGTLNA